MMAAASPRTPDTAVRRFQKKTLARSHKVDSHSNLVDPTLDEIVHELSAACSANA